MATELTGTETQTTDDGNAGGGSTTAADGSNGTETTGAPSGVTETAPVGVVASSATTAPAAVPEGSEGAAEGGAAPTTSVPPSAGTAPPEAPTEDNGPDLTGQLAELKADQASMAEHLKRLQVVAMDAALDSLQVLPEARDLIPPFDLSKPDGKAGLEEFVSKRPFLVRPAESAAGATKDRRVAAVREAASKGWLGGAADRITERYERKLAELGGGAK